MHLPIAHLSGLEEDPSEELQAQLQATHSGSQDDEGSHNSQSQGSGKEGSKDGASGDGSGAAPGGRPPKDLPCPRCQSMNTKFCYYNNYSVNQPRHFCRNCQRYWTVGGTLRNVPVGGGSRKKSSRSRSRSDPYYRPNHNALGTENDEAGIHDDECPSGQRYGQHPAMAPGFNESSYPDFPLHPSQISSFLQFALHGQPSHGPGLQFPAFLDSPGFVMSPEEESQLQAFYEASSSQSGMMSTAATMMGSGLWVPELEPAHVALMHKAAMWAEAQRLQSMARRAQAVAWADQERECKPVVCPPVLQRMDQGEVGQRQPVGMGASSLHRRPGFWETALMHSRPSRRPAGSSQTSPAWDETKPQGNNSNSQNTNMVSEEGAYSQGGYDVESSSWAPSSSLNSTNPEMFY